MWDLIRFRNIVLVIATILALPNPKSHARFDPLRVLSDQVLKPEITIVLDTSGSMVNGLITGYASGNDCSGHDSAVDICGDYMCTGKESRLSQSGRIYCNSDCQLPYDRDGYAIKAGSAEMCRNIYIGGKRNVDMDRLFLAKRALRNVLSDFRGVANFSLVTFGQTGYYNYTIKDGSSTQRTSLFLHKWELKSKGSWVQALGWNNTTDEPVSSFSVNGVTYKLLSAYTSAPGDSLYRAEEQKGFKYKRVNWSVGKGAFDDGTNKWTYQGSYYTYIGHGAVQQASELIYLTNVTCDQMRKNGWYYRWNGVNHYACHEGVGYCVGDYGCETGLKCQSINGKKYCLKPNTVNVQTTFKGPEYVSGSKTWVHYRFGSSYLGYIWGLSSGSIRVPLVEATNATPQEEFDNNLGQIFNHLNFAQHGGLVPSGGTPTCHAMNTAYTQIANRINGSGPFKKADDASFCRPRFVLVLSDGGSNSGCVRDFSAPFNQFNSVQYQAKRLFDDYGVITIGMTVPGADYNGTKEMDFISDCGDDGVCDNDSKDAIVSNTEKELVDQLRKVIYEAIQGEYTTSASGITWSGSGSVDGDISLTPTTSFPGWKGKLVAHDLKVHPPKFLWEAADGKETDSTDGLNGRDWKSRVIYSGTHTYNSGVPFKLFNSGGSVALAAVKAVWPGTKPTDTEIISLIQWLAGKGRTWKLPPIINSVPATVGPPPDYKVSDHADYMNKYRDRQRLVYVTSNEGLLHAFDAINGHEVFAYLAPHHLPTLYKLYKAGGQDEDPSKLTYISANSVRVEDIRVNGSWKTQMIVTDGPGSEYFTVLDISQMPSCNDAHVCSGSVGLKVDFSSSVVSILDAKFGETWSIPAIFWDSTINPQLALGSGYGSSTQGEWYNFFTDMTHWSTNTKYYDVNQQPGSGAGVDYGVFADTVAIADGEKKIISTYQADLYGNIYAYKSGDPDFDRKLIELGNTQPIHFSPAALYYDNTEVFLAINTGAYQDDDIVYQTNPTKVNYQKLILNELGSKARFEAKLYIYRDDLTSKTLKKAEWECVASDICNSKCGLAIGVDDDKKPVQCKAPSEHGLPISSPMLAYNETTKMIEAYFVIYDPPVAGACKLSGATCDLANKKKCPAGQRCKSKKCYETGIGDSYVYRIILDPKTGSTTMTFAAKHENVQASGLTFVGGGKVALSKSGRGDSKAEITTIDGKEVSKEMKSTGGTPTSETWKEVR